MIKSNIGENIKQLRLEKNISIEELCEFVGISAETLEDWESGKVRIISSDYLTLLTKLFGVTTGELLSGKFKGANANQPAPKPNSQQPEPTAPKVPTLENLSKDETATKGLFLEKYKSIRDTSMETETHYAITDNIFKNGTTQDNAANISKILNTVTSNINEFVHGPIPSLPLITASIYTADEVQLVEIFRNLNDEGRSYLIDYLHMLLSTEKFRLQPNLEEEKA